MKYFILFHIFFYSLHSHGVSDVFNYKEFETQVKGMMKDFNVPGMAIGIVRKNKVLYKGAYGVRSKKTNKPVTFDTQFAIGSTSKAFTATALGILKDKGLIGWDKPIKSHYIPSFELSDSTATNLTTIRDLLLHRVGLPRHESVWHGTSFTREELFQNMKYLDFSSSFREVVRYQNLMYMTAGYVSGQVTGSSWESVVSKNIFLPLEMNNSNFSITDMKKTSDFAYPHMTINQEVVQVPHRNVDAIGPAGSINSSVNDMVKWVQLQLSNGKFQENKLIEPKTLNEIHRGQEVSNIINVDKIWSEFGIEHYGLGWVDQTFYGKRMIYHSGSIDGFLSFVAFLPDLDKGIVVLANSDSYVPYYTVFTYFDQLINGKSRSLWRDRLKKVTAVSHEVETLEHKPLINSVESYYGTYFNPGYGEISISESYLKDCLKVKHYSHNYTYCHKGNHSFLVNEKGSLLRKNSKPLSFEFDSNGSLEKVLFKLEMRVEAIPFIKD